MIQMVLLTHLKAGFGKKRVTSCSVACVKNISQKHPFPFAVWLTLSFGAVAYGAEDVRQEMPDFQEKVSAVRSHAKHATKDPFLNLLNSINVLKSVGQLKNESSNQTAEACAAGESRWEIDRSIISYTDTGPWGDFEGLEMAILQNGDERLLAKPFMAMQVCTNEDQEHCYRQPPFFLYKFDDALGEFVDVSHRITNPDEFLIPTQWSYLAADFNGDDKTDLVFGTNGEHFSPIGKTGEGWRWENFILASNKDGTYTWRLLHPFQGITRALSAGDIDNDGDLDLFIDDAGKPDDPKNNLYPDEWGGYFLINDGSATFTRGQQRFPQTTTSTLADLDNDGYLDLALNAKARGCQDHRESCRLFNGVFVYRNNRDYTFSEVASNIPYSQVHSYNGDDDWVIKVNDEEKTFVGLRQTVALLANADDMVDLAVSVETEIGHETFTSILINRGNFEFEVDFSRIEHVQERNMTNRVVAMDVDEDGHTDLYFVRKRKQKGKLAENFISEEIYFNDGDGYFSNENRLGLPKENGLMTIGDVNSDGVKDVIASPAYDHAWISESQRSRTSSVYIATDECVPISD